MRDLPFRDQAARQLSLPSWHQHQSCAHKNPCVHHAGHSCDVKHRNDQQAYVFVGSISPIRCGHSVVHDASMRMHATFGQTGGATGVGQYRQILDPYCDGAKIKVVGYGMRPIDYFAAMQLG